MPKLNLPEQTLQKLHQMLNARSATYTFLGFTLDMETGVIVDKLSNTAWKDLAERLIPAMLYHYSLGQPTTLTGKLVKFKDLPGGYAYEGAFVQRAIKPIAKAFAQQPQDLPQAGKLLGGTPLSLGDYSIEITALKGIPLTYILWKADEFPSSANILYDQSASNYLPTEDLAVLGELTTSRLIEAKQAITTAQ